MATSKSLYKLHVQRTRVRLAEAGAGGFNKVIRTSDDAAKLLRPLLEVELVEVFCLLALDNKHRVIGYVEVARGGMTDIAIEPCNTLRAALLSGGVAFIVAHNHPSGDPTPSPSDLESTRRFNQAFELVGLRLLDHVIVAHEGHYSFADAGAL